MRLNRGLCDVTKDNDAGKMTPLDIVKDILQFKKGIYSGLDEGGKVDRTYAPFLINRTISMHPELVLFANEMNLHSDLPLKLQHDYFFHFIPGKKRAYMQFHKHQKRSSDEDFLAVQEYFGFNDEKTRRAIQILQPEQIKFVKQKLFKGGRT
jgi:hypothetical protein